MFMMRAWPNAILHIDNHISCFNRDNKENIQGRFFHGDASKDPFPKSLTYDYDTQSFISKRMFSVVRRFSEHVDAYSIDQAFVDLSDLGETSGMTYFDLSERIKSTVEEELDISVSLGLSITKTLAKLASKCKKSSRFSVVTGYNLTPFLKRVPISEICGDEPDLNAYLQDRNVFTAFDYVNRSEMWARSLLGEVGSELWYELQGEMVYLFDTARNPLNYVI
jgi:nucleotidyltransferase/DNA polymerase involved in DNA repair